jgi:hypothetical protein
LRTLVYTILILIAAASLSYAQSGGDRDTRLLAKAETRTSSATYDTRNGETLKRETEKPVPEPTGTVEDPADTYLAIKNELETEKNANFVYNSDSLKSEDLPMVITSADRKTISVVFPPFLYFKKLF